ncbi:MAG: hypothetical protein ACOC6D_04010 [Atribacterota bacterium]
MNKLRSKNSKRRKNIVKIVLLILSAFIIVFTLHGCGTEEEDSTSVESGTEESSEISEETATEDAEETSEVSEESAGAKTGLSVDTSLEKSTDSSEEDDGLAQVDSVIVAVITDSENRIANCAIDSAQTKINFSDTGEIITPLDKVFVGKQELGEEYGMIEASSIGKEWNEQATALSNYVIGKTVEEVKGIAVNEEGTPTESELTSSVTMHITNYISGIEKAVNQAENRGASADDKLGIGVITTIDRSEDATAEEEGLAQAYSTYAAVTFDEEGIITSCIIDSSQANVNFNQEGEITSDLSISPKTKNELGDEYDMKSVSEIGREWYEQADAFAEYTVGKTIDEVKGISLNEEGVPTESELTSSVTIHVGPFVTVIEKAYDAAK